ncbi:MAG: haloacid dehalogenase type II [Burkholderiales bacterium]|nr:haloacid dehalogenase type II [Burkholderiales bacterium]
MGKRLSDFRVLSFDCYGTLVDWETGLRAGLGPLAARAGLAPDADAVLETFARHEAAQQRETPALRYSALLAAVYRRVAAEWGVPATPAEAEAFGASVGDWPAFPDTPGALAYLKRHFKLVILSNVDRASFARTNARLRVAFDAILTAEDIGSYKPDPRNFARLLAEVAGMGGREELLHVAESLYHDHAPAQAAGIATAWIHRRHAQGGFGATRAPEDMPAYDFRFLSLGELAEAHRREAPP